MRARTYVCPRCQERPKVRDYCGPCHKELRRADYARNKEKQRAQMAAYQAANPERAREYRKENRERRVRQTLEWRQANRDRSREHSRRAKTKRRGCTPTEEANEYDRILRLDPCCYCGAPTEQVDHIVPIVRGGGGDWDNLTAACTRCNASKGAKPLLHFLLEQS